MKIRQPIVSVLGHVDSGKTSLLDAIRETSVASREAGAITQHIGASEIPLENILKICSPLVKNLKLDIKIPGLLFIDTPGHEAFSTLRKRGGSIADMAVLVIDINKGVEAQTRESLIFLKEFKTPFIVAATKIDLIPGYRPIGSCPFTLAINTQEKRFMDILDEKIYRIVAQLYENGISSDRYDRIDDFSKKVAIVPVSNVTRDGVADVLVLLAGIAQKYLKEKIKVNEGVGRGTILEVKNVKGMGTVIEVILYDGEVKKGDYLLVGGKGIVETRIRGIFRPRPMSEMRTEKKFISVESVHASAGIRIVANGLENAIAGFPVRTFEDEKMVEKMKEEIKKEVGEVEFETSSKGAIVKADTLGSLEAMVHMLREIDVKIRKASIGKPTHQEILEAKSVNMPVFAFNVEVSDDIMKFAKDNGVKIFSSNVIYKVVEEYKKWDEKMKMEKEMQLMKKTTRPGKVKVLRGCVFRQSKPAIFGVEVLGGTIKPGYFLKKNEKIIGSIKEIQSSGENVGEAKIGDKVAISMDGVTFGRQIKEDDILIVNIEKKDIEALEKIKSKLRDDEISLLEEYKKVK